MHKNLSVLFLVSLLACASGGVAPTTATTGETAPLVIDFGPLSSTYPTLKYQVPYAPDSQPIDYLQSATTMNPPVTYTCATDNPHEPCYKTLTSDCAVTMINGVGNQVVDKKAYEWLWFIDGNVGALSPCIFSIYGSKNVITFKLTAVDPNRGGGE